MTFVGSYIHVCAAWERNTSMCGATALSQGARPEPLCGPAELVAPRLAEPEPQVDEEFAKEKKEDEGPSNPEVEHVGLGTKSGSELEAQNLNEYLLFVKCDKNLSELTRQENIHMQSDCMTKTEAQQTDTLVEQAPEQEEGRTIIKI